MATAADESSPPRVGFVVVNWNQRDLKLACLASLGAQDHPAFDVVLVDNGSADDSIASIRAAFPAVTVIENGANLGIAAANNVGIRWALAGTFDGIEAAAARPYCQRFFHWYNTIHYHSGIGYLTPVTIHTGQVEAIRSRRQAALVKAFAAHPTRFTPGRPLAPSPPSEVWINQPALEVADSAAPATTNPSLHESDPVVARDAPTQAHSQDAQAGSTAAEGRAQRSVAAGEHPATPAANVSTKRPRPAAGGCSLNCRTGLSHNA